MRLTCVQIENVSEIEPRVRELWNEIVTPELCKNLYDGIPGRLEAVIKNKGARIHH